PGARFKMTNEWSEGDALANGVRIHYYRTGGEKPSVVLLHGFTDSGLCWMRVAERLQSDYDVVMLDARGHGKSDAPASGYTAEDHAPELAGAIQSLGLDRPVLLGHSMGGATAVATAKQFPSLVRALILEDPPWGGASPALSDAERQKRIAELRASLMKRKTQPLDTIIAYARQHFPTWDERELEPWAVAKQQTSPNIAQVMMASGVRWQDVIACVTCPVLVITADAARGVIVTPETIREAQSLCPTLTSVHIAGAGHNIRREQFEPFVQTVCNDLARVYADT
ncbi:MAG: alpha/beta hydrolase, partial [Chloroflexi bacterium]|nr:alpha/beta hydrolase [Chloroflexota bacterium]